MKLLLPVLTILTLTASADAQQASYVIVGSGCSSGRLTPTVGPVPFAVEGLPRLGGSFTVVTEGTADYPWGHQRYVWLFTGVSNTSMGGVPLPFDIATLFPGQPYCGLLRTSAEAAEYAPFSPDYRARVRMPIAVPNMASLAGVRFYQQVFTMERAWFGPPFRAGALSAGGAGTIGF